MFPGEVFQQQYELSIGRGKWGAPQSSWESREGFTKEGAFDLGLEG